MVNDIGRENGCEWAAEVKQGVCSVARARVRGESRVRKGSMRATPLPRVQRASHMGARVAAAPQKGSHVGRKILCEEHAVGVSAL